MVNQQVLPQMRLLCFPYEEECRIYFACYTSMEIHGKSMMPHYISNKVWRNR